ncbi:hypothetical protein [Actinoplanes sp. NPDC051411]|uniref:hypothetical protein n=1 Tax=Actinoplanes sp. NPDC051411 TaxID=3155522 RepID=UPI00343E5333
MRHFRSILYAVVLAAAVWVLVAVGLSHDVRGGFAVESLTGLAMLLLGGAAYGILVFAPISPLGPTVAGAAFLAAGAWAIESPSAYAGAWPAGAVKDGFDLSRPGYGLAALLSVPMILTVLSVRRWRGFEPPVLPLVGQIGRTRGVVAGPGAPMGVMETGVLPLSGSSDSGSSVEEERTTLMRLFETPEERTTLLRRPVVQGESTTVVRRPTDGEATTIIRRVPGEASTADLNAERPTDERVTEDVRSGEAFEEPTTVFVVQASATDIGEDETTTVVVAEEATADIPAEEPTTVFVTQVDETVRDEPLTEAISVGAAATAGLDDPAAEGLPPEPEGADHTAKLVAEEATTDLVADNAAVDAEPTPDAAAEPVATDVAVQESRSAGNEEPVEADKPGAASVTESDGGAEEPADLPGFADGEETTDLAAAAETEPAIVAGSAPVPPAAAGSAPAEGDERPGIEEPAAGLVPVMVSSAAEPEDDGQHVVGVAEAAAAGVLAEEVEETTYLIVAGETPEFEVLPLPGERTVEVRPAGRIPGETTQILGGPGEETRVILRRTMDETQVIRPPDDGGRTQLLGSSRFARPAEPVAVPADPASETNTADIPATAAESPAARESTTVENLAREGDSGRPANGRPGPHRGGSIVSAESPNFADDPTGRLQVPAAVPDEPARTMTVMNMERPPEDVPEIPSPRRSPESEG